MISPIKPANGKVLLQIEKLKKVSKIHNPKAPVKTQYRILACSDGLEFQAGDLVIYDKSKGIGRELNGGEYVLVDPEFIFGVVKENK